jgi:hypothetical protein
MAQLRKKRLREEEASRKNVKTYGNAAISKKFFEGCIEKRENNEYSIQNQWDDKRNRVGGRSHVACVSYRW